MDIHLHALYGWSRQQISNKMNSRPARNTEYLELEMYVISFGRKSLSTHADYVLFVPWTDVLYNIEHAAANDLSPGG